MLSSLTADITLTEITLAQVCELIEKAELERRWACMVDGPMESVRRLR